MQPRVFFFCGGLVEERVHRAVVGERVLRQAELTSWCHNLSVRLQPECRVMCCLYLPSISFQGGGGGNRKASCISPSILLQSSLIFSSIPTESLHVYSYVLHLSLFFFFKFSAFSIPRWGNAISTHTRLMCYTPASQLHSRSQSLNKSPPPLPTMPDGVICARRFH